MKVVLEGKNIPRNKNGDPAFQFLRIDDVDRAINNNPTAILDIFTPEEVVELVNRCLYQLEYQKTSHRNKAQKERETWAPIKKALKLLHPSTSFAKATEKQLDDAIKFVKSNPTDPRLREEGE